MRAAYEARLILEPGAARLAARRQLEEPLARTRAALVAQRRSGRSVQRSFEANRDFHLSLVAASGNEFLTQLSRRLWVARIGAAIYERQIEAHERMLLDVAEHERILAAIESGDGRQAESLTRRHLADAMKRSLGLLES
jgi:DNA-binding GntR family transcriptional regulator